MPGYAGNNYAMASTQGLTAVPGAATVGPSNMSAPQSGAYFAQNVPAAFPPYSHGHPTQQGSMGPPMMETNNMASDFASAQTVETPAQYQSSSSQQVSPNQDFATTLEQTPTIGSAGNQSLDTPYFDPNDSSLFNFSISDLNFGNHYGALEFGMLGHISSGAVNTPDMDSMNQMNQGSMSFDNNANYPSGFNNYSQNFPSWQNAPAAASRQSSTTNANAWATQHNGLEAYAIGEQASSLTGASPHSQSQDFTGYQSMSPETQFVQPEQTQQPDLLRQSLSQAQRKPPPFPGDPSSDASRKRRRNVSDVYTTVQAPYSYTQGFHALTAFLQKRFSTKKVLRIAKALATIRPSFISCNQRLDQQDLIFMEKCFQRTLCEYEDFINHYGTPTVICRRTGEIAAVSKEFCLVTGWRRDILLGKEPNLNVNTGSNVSGTQTGTSSRGQATPRIPNLEADSGRPQPVFLAELLDEDSVVQFYEDFSELAFGASRTSIQSAPCSLLKYRTKEDPGWGLNDHLAEDGKRVKKPGEVKGEPLIRGEAGMNALGERDGRVECQMCWTVKRDTFDIPMLIVMNVSITYNVSSRQDTDSVSQFLPII